MSDAVQPLALSRKAASLVTGLSESTLRRRARQQQAPAFCRIGGRVVYLREDLQAFLEQNRVPCQG